jgi:hypothetical protein
MSKETSYDLVLVMDSIGDATVGTWVKFEKEGGSLRVRTQKNGKKFSISHAEGLSDWDSNQINVRLQYELNF